MARTSIGDLYARLSVDSRGLRADSRKAVAILQRQLSLSAQTINRTLARALRVGITGAFASAAGAAAGLTIAINRSRQEIDNLAKDATRIGVATEELQAIRLAAEEAGASTESLTRTINRMQDSIADAAQSGSGALQEAFNAINLEAQQLIDLDPAEQFLRVAEALGQVQNEAQRVQLTRDIFGRAGLDIAPLLTSNIRGTVDDTSGFLSGVGATIRTEGAREVEKMNDTLARLGVAFGGFISQLTIELAPAITAISEQILDEVRILTERMPDLDIAKELESHLENMVSFTKDIAGELKVISSTLEGVADVFSAIEYILKALSIANLGTAVSHVGVSFASSKKIFETLTNVKKINKALEDTKKLDASELSTKRLDDILDLTPSFRGRASLQKQFKEFQEGIFQHSRKEGTMMMGRLQSSLKSSLKEMKDSFGPTLFKAFSEFGQSVPDAIKAYLLFQLADIGDSIEETIREARNQFLGGIEGIQDDARSVEPVDIQVAAINLMKLELGGEQARQELDKVDKKLRTLSKQIEAHRKTGMVGEGTAFDKYSKQLDEQMELYQALSNRIANQKTLKQETLNQILGTGMYRAIESGAIEKMMGFSLSPAINLAQQFASMMDDASQAANKAREKALSETAKSMTVQPPTEFDNQLTETLAGITDQIRDTRQLALPFQEITNELITLKTQATEAGYDVGFLNDKLAEVNEASMRELNYEMKDLAEQLSWGADQFSELKERLIEVQNADVSVEVKINAQQAMDNIKSIEQGFYDVADAIGNSVGSAIDRVIDTGRLDFKSFVADILRDIAKIYARLALFGSSGSGGLLGPLLGGLTSSLGGLFGGGGTGVTISEGANARFAAGIPMMSEGGRIGAGKMAIVGERGMELFLPTTSGTVIPNHEIKDYTTPDIEQDKKGGATYNWAPVIHQGVDRNGLAIALERAKQETIREVFAMIEEGGAARSIVSRA